MLGGAKGFNELHRGLPGISRSVLTDRMRSLERAEIVARRTGPKGRTLEYQLTPAGRDLSAHGIIAALPTDDNSVRNDCSEGPPPRGAAHEAAEPLVSNHPFPNVGVAALPAHAVLKGLIVFPPDAQSGSPFTPSFSLVVGRTPSLVQGIPRDLGHAPVILVARARIVATEALSKHAIHRP